MRRAFVFFILIFIIDYASSQEVVHIKGKGYEGFIFPKEHPLWGFPPEPDRRTPTPNDIALAEQILKDSIATDYVRSLQGSCRKPPINKKTLRKYTRQYVGYATEDGSVIIQLFLSRGTGMDKALLSEDIIAVQDGGSNHWRIKINLSTRELFDMQINGTG